MKEVLLPWQRDGTSPSKEGCDAHGEVQPEETVPDEEQRERERETAAAVQKVIASIDDVMSQMRVEAERLGLSPEDMVLTSEGIRPAEIEWTEHPGCFERHLQRKNRNPLFPEAARRVTARDVAAARESDLREADEFRVEVQSLLDGLRSDFSGEQAVTYSQLDARRQRIEELQHRANELGGDLERERETLTKLHVTVLEAMRAALADHPEAQAMLDQARDHQRSAEYLLLTGSMFIAQMGRSGTPITASEAIPALLSEDPATIRVCMKAMAGQDQIGMIRDEARALLTSVIERGEVVPEAKEKLRALGVASSDP